MSEKEMENIRQIWQKMRAVVERYPRLLLLGGLGLLLLIGAPVLETNPAEETMHEMPRTEGAEQSEEAVWEDKLERILSTISGAGAVEVVVQIEEAKRIEHEKNRTHEKRSTTEGDGRAVTVEEKMTEELPMRRENGMETPVVARALRPSITGVLVVAEGGASSVVRANIRDAVRAATGVAPYRVKVLAKRREAGAR